MAVNLDTNKLTSFNFSLYMHNAYKNKERKKRSILLPQWPAIADDHVIFTLTAASRFAEQYCSSFSLSSFFKRLFSVSKLFRLILQHSVHSFLRQGKKLIRNPQGRDDLERKTPTCWSVLRSFYTTFSSSAADCLKYSAAFSRRSVSSPNL